MLLNNSSGFDCGKVLDNLKTRCLSVIYAVIWRESKRSSVNERYAEQENNKGARTAESTAGRCGER